MSTLHTPPFGGANPLDTLLVQQLEDIIREEKWLANKYPSLSSPSQTIEARQAFSDELTHLNRRADRLQRLIDAMEVVGFNQPTQSDSTPTLVA